MSVSERDVLGEKVKVGEMLLKVALSQVREREQSECWCQHVEISPLVPPPPPHLLPPPAGRRQSRLHGLRHRQPRGRLRGRDVDSSSDR